jgi:hypothetical protein
MRSGNLLRPSILISLLVLSILLCGTFLFSPPIRARYLFNKLKPLQVGHSTFEDAQRLAAKLGAKPNIPCDPSYCFWSVVINNARLPQWWRGPGATFVITFDVKNSVVENKGTGYAIGIDTDGASPSEVRVGVQEKWLRNIVEPPTQKGWQVSYLERHGHRENISTIFHVHMTPRSSAEDWQRYTAFNYSCFWKYKGCRDARGLLPTADPFPDNL